ncbi:hypothetical protein INN71_02525 [Nocardioides sp. ChNu-153]|uniref:hypothetical protein n=1 Tax=unclassified Nocardioides TaxID=2615069 RepID=UPI0024070EB2|nr:MULTISPECIES: hypothetical protein [unclassified Nocardioides]MDF9717637.1 hypothetical protein [Nocardioides sp. ChNu-99]MDN7120260.1 hypothetical protein [Nocardioides sp. ChNu-153]
MTNQQIDDDELEAQTLATWIQKSGGLSDSSYLEGVHQTCLLLRKTSLWNKVAQILVDRGVLTLDMRRWTSGIAPDADDGS